METFRMLFLCLAIFIPKTVGLAVMSVDLGSAWMKIAIVSPGVPMEIVLNRESKRKTPVVLSFRDDEREIGDAALAVGVRFPEATYTHTIDLLGKKIGNLMVEKFQSRFPYHKLIGDEKTQTIVFERDEKNNFKIEELISMLLNRAREYAQEFAGQSIKDVVITVPVFFNQAERRALMRAAELANLKVLQLINTNTAVALNYGVFRRKDFNTTAQNIMFFDMGASTTTATIVAYQLVKTKERGFVESNPQLTVLGVGYERQLGGFDFTLRLRDHLAQVFNEQKKTENDVFKSHRAMSKLLKEAERVKMVLSANTDHYAQVENLLDDKDFRAQVTREEIEAMCEDLLNRVGNPVSEALKDAAMSMDNIDQVILVGAATRMPKVQEKLLQVVKKEELGKNLNTDEAAALGAVYQAAHLSQGFKVKKFLIKDAVLFPIQVDFERELENGKETKNVSRTLFARGNPYPLKKVITFNRLSNDAFTFRVNYGKIEMPSEDRQIFGSFNLSKIELQGIKNAMDKHISDESESKGVKSHFRMDESGLLTLDLAESVFEQVSDTDGDAESAFSKLGSTISKLFSGGTPDETLKTEEIPEKTEETEKKVENTTETPSNATSEQKVENTTDTKNETKAVKPKIVTIKEPLTISQVKLDVEDPPEDEMTASAKRIEVFNHRERKQKQKEEAKNSLESFILDSRDKLYQDDYMKASTDDERSKIEAEMSAASDWLDEEGENVDDAAIYKEKLSKLHVVTNDLFARVKEHKDRPEILKAMQELVNMSQVFLEKIRELSENEQYFTDVEIDLLEKTLNDTKEWRDTKLQEQEKRSLHEKPIMTVRSIAEKMTILDREVKYLVNKARTAKPKPKKQSVNDTKAEDGATNNATNATSENTSKEEKVEESSTVKPDETETQDTAHTEL
uniref:Hypoxia up-regulated protein 1 n=1 Tax=Strigamia maritima TaxID=126957 RepID=T1IXH5_STRMM